jgi:hypothetical protein
LVFFAGERLAAFFDFLAADFLEVFLAAFFAVAFFGGARFTGALRFFGATRGIGIAAASATNGTSIIVTIVVRPKHPPKADNDNEPYDHEAEELKELYDDYNK